MQLTILLQELLAQELMTLELLMAGSVVQADASLLDSVQCADITLDSRHAVEGGIFIAMPGAQVDGRDYIQAVLDEKVAVIFYEIECLSKKQRNDIEQASCVCVGVPSLQSYASEIAAIFFNRPSDVLQVYGVTGTNGKTSCAYLLAQSFNHLGYKTAFMGTIGVGLPLELSVTTHTTLDAVALQRYMAELVAQDFTHACIEVSSHALDQGRVSAVNFYAVLYTNLSQDHLDYHGTMQSYAAVKKQLFTQFSPSLAVINIDDQFGQALIEESNAEFIVSYGKEGSTADAVAEDVTASRQGLSFVLEAQALEVSIESTLLGLLNVPNLTLVASTLLALGVDVEQIESAVSECQAAPGRMELFANADKPMVVVDYAHTPDAIKLALESCRVHCQGKLWIVFGCGGDRDQSKRPLMGQMAENFADNVVVCSDNPRSENAEDIIAEIIKPMAQAPVVIENRATAIAYAIDNAASDDLVLLAGKGHETGQIIGDQVLPYSDREWAMNCLGVAA